MLDILSRLAALAVVTAANDCARAQEAQEQAEKEGEAFQQRLFGRPLGAKPIHVCFIVAEKGAVVKLAELQREGFAYLRRDEAWGGSTFSRGSDRSSAA